MESSNQSIFKVIAGCLAVVLLLFIVMLGVMGLFLSSITPPHYAPNAPSEPRSAAVSEPATSNQYQSGLDNLFKTPAWMENKFGKSNIQTYEKPIFESPYFALIAGAKHSRHAAGDFKITVAYINEGSATIRYQRSAAPFQLDNYEIQQILAANSGGLIWHQQNAPILNLTSSGSVFFKRDDGATATIAPANIYITIESPTVKSFIEQHDRELTEQRHRKAPTF
jgi:hypothetical protein